MKRGIAFVMILALCLALPAVAENLVAERGNTGLYIGFGDRIYPFEGDKPLTRDTVIAIYAADSLYALYMDSEHRLCCLDLSGDDPYGDVIAMDTLDATWSEDEGLLYYVSSESPRDIFNYDPTLRQTKDPARADGDITALRMSADGPLVTIDEEELLYVSETGEFTQPLYPVGDDTLQVGDGFETLLSQEGTLLLRLKGETTARTLGQNVLGSEIYLSTVNYLEEGSESLNLMVYSLSSDSTSLMEEFREFLSSDFAVGGGWAFLSNNRTRELYGYQYVSGSITSLGFIPESVSYSKLRAGQSMVFIYDMKAEPGKRFIMAIPSGPFDQEDC